MTYTLLVVLLLLGLALYLDKNRLGRSVTLYIVISFVVYFLPQMIVFNWSQPDHEYSSSAELFILLSFSAYFFAYYFVSPKIINTNVSISNNPIASNIILLRHYIPVIVVYFVIGSYFKFLVSTLAVDVNLATGGQWSGIITIYFFFSGLFYISFVASVILLLSGVRKIALYIIVVSVIVYALTEIIFLGRRSVLIELSIGLVLPYLIIRNKKVNIFFVGVAFPLLFFLFSFVGEYRSIVASNYFDSGSFASIAQIMQAIDLVFTVNKVDFDPYLFAADYRNYLASMQLALDHGTYDFGASLWNSIVHRYVPAQIVGADFKEWLTLDLNSHRLSVSGSMLTGFGVAFSSYGYLGLFLFFLFGLWSYRLRNNVRTDRLSNFLLFALMVYPFVLMFLSSVYYPILSFIALYIFLTPFRFVERVKFRL